MYYFISILIFLILILFLIKRNHQGDTYDVPLVKIKSQVDGNYYEVRDVPQKQETADILARLHAKNMKFLNYAKKNAEGREVFEAILRIIYLYKANTISEGKIEKGMTAYSVNKQNIVFCLWDREQPSKKIDENLVFYVNLHELAHMGCTSVGHTVEWKNLFDKFIELAVKDGIYREIDFDSSMNYCGVSLT